MNRLFVLAFLIVIAAVAMALWVFRHSESDGTPEGEPARIILAENSPDPFFDHTLIHFSLPDSMHVRLTLRSDDEAVRPLVDEVRGPGWHEIELSAESLEFGTYSYRLEAAGRTMERELHVVPPPAY